MKQSRFLLMPLFAAMILFFSSCGDNEEKTETDAVTTDTAAAATTTPEPAAVAQPVNIMIVKHKVANFSKWKPSYESHDSMRLASGIHSFVIGRGVQDSNMVMVAVKVDDVEKAKAFSKDPGLKKAMQQGGVVGTPTIMLLTVPYLSASDNSTLRSMVTHTVKDWEAWKTGFESNRQVRLDNGLTDRAYGYDVDDNHKVTVVVSITDTAKANAFMKSDLLKQKMKEGGVVGEPTRFIYRVVQTY
ncbi:MAG: hypothetical protein H7122_16080 [Chitinophagaceae bacterium]|nr:hypothetical protein [Chitinophagaceae bacterium]